MHADIYWAPLQNPSTSGAVGRVMLDLDQKADQYAADAAATDDGRMFRASVAASDAGLWSFPVIMVSFNAMTTLVGAPDIKFIKPKATS